MSTRITRTAICLILAITAFGAMPKASEAQVGWYNPATGVWQYRAFRPLWPWRRGIYTSTVRAPVATTVYRPVVSTGCNTCFRPVVASCNTCAPCTTTVRYAPQTCYRPQVVTVPTVAYQPVQQCDACSGCCQTVLRPVTRYVQQVRQVAYTTLRPIYTRSCASPCSTCASPCATCGVTGCTSCATTGTVTSSCASGQCGSGTTINYPAANAEYQEPAAAEEKPALDPNENPGKTEAQKVEANDDVTPEAEQAPAALQEIDRTKADEFAPPALLNPLDRQASRTTVRPASYKTKATPQRRKMVWKAAE